MANRMRRFGTLLSLLCLLAAPAGCGDKAPPQGELIFWHMQSQDNAVLLQQIVDDYNAADPPMKVSLRYVGGYTDLFRKVRATIATNKMPPDLVVAYESMVAEYIELGAAVALDDYIADPEVGLPPADLADIFPGILAGNRYPTYGNLYYTFPFTKSVLMMYYNRDMLRQAGLSGEPPVTWSEFKEACKAVRAAGRQGYALSVDASTVDAMVMSFGGELLDEANRRALFDSPASLAAFRLIHDMARDGLCYQIDTRSYGDRKDFASGLCAFMIRSSTTRPYIEKDIEDRFDWDMAIIPHAEGVDPVTVLFGANIAVLRTTPERQRAAWRFVRYFSSSEVTARWAMGTGYLPVRASAAKTPAVRAFFEERARNRRAFDALAHARTEPGVAGWQAVRTEIELAEADAVRNRIPPKEIAEKLSREANIALSGGGSGHSGPTAVSILAVAGILAALLAAGLRKRNREATQ